jgi:hypothetical protein
MNDRRFMIFKISEDTVASLLRYDGLVLKVVSSQWPEDGKVSGVTYDHLTGCFHVRVYSESFEPVLEGSKIPMQSRSVEIEVMNPDFISPS